MKLFATSRQTASNHKSNILKDNELDKNSVVKEFLTTASDLIVVFIKKNISRICSECFFCVKKHIFTEYTKKIAFYYKKSLYKFA